MGSAQSSDPGVGPAARPRVLTQAVQRVAEILGLNHRALGRIIGASEATISRLGARTLLDPDEKRGELAILLVRAYRSLDALLGGDEAKCRLWFQAENAALGGVPARLAERPEGLIDVVHYLDAMRGRL